MILRDFHIGVELIAGYAPAALQNYWAVGEMLTAKSKNERSVCYAQYYKHFYERENHFFVGSGGDGGNRTLEVVKEVRGRPEISWNYKDLN